MTVLLLTIFVSLALAAFFVALFILQRRGDFSSSPEHDALLPLQEENVPASALVSPVTPKPRPEARR